MKFAKKSPTFVNVGTPEADDDRPLVPSVFTKRPRLKTFIYFPEDTDEQEREHDSRQPAVERDTARV